MTISKILHLYLLIFGLVFFMILNLTKPFLLAEEKGLGLKIGYIDAHNHLHGHIRSPSGVVVDYEGAARVALSTMDKLGIKKMIVMPPPFPLNHPHTYEIDNFDFIRTLRKYSNRLVFLGGGGTLNVIIQRAVHEGKTSPSLQRSFEKKALELLSKGALGFGEMTAEHFCLGPRHNYQTAPPDHPLFLLLADISARHGVPIDIHMEAISERMLLPQRLRFPENPESLNPNIEAFEQLLAHNRGAKIIWAHVGWDNTGHRTAKLTSELLKKHPNLYMSFKISPRDSLIENCPIEPGIGLKAEWLKVISEFPDRFIIGTDHFYTSPQGERIGPQRAEIMSEFFSLLSPELAQKVGIENPKLIFNL